MFCPPASTVPNLNIRRFGCDLLFHGRLNIAIFTSTQEEIVWCLLASNTGLRDPQHGVSLLDAAALSGLHRTAHVFANPICTTCRVFDWIRQTLCSFSGQCLNPMRRPFSTVNRTRGLSGGRFRLPAHIVQPVCVALADVHVDERV